MARETTIDRSPARDDRQVVERTEIIQVPMDRGVHWGAVWAGLLTAISLFVLLGMLAAAIGLATFEPGAAGQVAVMQTGGLVGAVIALISFLLGGMVAGRSAGVGGREIPFLQGFLVWALGLVLILIFAGLGLGTFFGVAGEQFAQFQQMAMGAMDQAQLQQVQAGALGAFVGVMLMAIAATIGGWLGAMTRPPRPDA